MIRVEALDSNREREYNDFVLSCPAGMLYHSIAYKRLLENILGIHGHYLIAYRDDEMIAALPTFVSAQGRLGTILNSLPFYGSHGGVLQKSANSEAETELTRALHQLISTNHCAAATLIAEPGSSGQKLYLDHFIKIDDRIGQITRIPSDWKRGPETVLADIHQKTRNGVRKAIKSGIQVSVEYEEAAFRFLEEVHCENMRAIGGIAKPSAFFSGIRKCFEAGKNMFLYVAKQSSQRVAALLLLSHGRTVEYFTPVIIEKFRTFQPLALIIATALADFANMGFTKWNWGGTWKTQTGVYRFKKRWCAEDMPYSYYSMVFDNNLWRSSRAELLAAYPFFYVLPFEKLRA